LIDKYGDDIIITTNRGKKSVVCFKNTGLKLLKNAWYDSKKEDKKEERLKLVEAATTIIGKDIRSLVYETKSLPPSNQFMKNVKEHVSKSLFFV